MASPVHVMASCVQFGAQTNPIAYCSWPLLAYCSSSVLLCSVSINPSHFHHTNHCNHQKNSPLLVNFTCRTSTADLNLRQWYTFPHPSSTLHPAEALSKLQDPSRETNCGNPPPSLSVSLNHRIRPRRSHSRRRHNRLRTSHPVPPPPLICNNT